MAKPTMTQMGAEALKTIRKGVNAVYIPVSKTLGPQGGNALLYRTFNRGPRITNDGVTVSEVIEPKEPFTRIVSQSFKEACKRTNEKVGDGTTGTTVIAGKLVNDVLDRIESTSSAFVSKETGNKYGVMTIRREIISEAEKVKKLIRERSKKIESIEELERIATISVENEELGKIVAGMVWETGIDGFIDVVEGFHGKIETEIIKGMRFSAKPANKAFVNNPARHEMVIQDCPVLISNIALDNAAQLGDFTKKINTSKLLIFAPSFSENVLVNMAQAAKNGFFIYPVAIPSLRTEQLEDLAIYCDAKLIDKNKGNSIESAQPDVLGFLEKLIVKDTEAKEDAVATGGRGTVLYEKQIGENPVMSSKIADRIEVLKGQLNEQRQPQFKKLLERRIASMASAVGIIRVGASSEVESLYQKLKIEDAVYAAKAALRSGYVKGGGLALKEIAEELPESILTNALKAPYEQIQENAGEEVEIGDDIIDPTDAVFYEVEYATSVAANLVTVKVIIPELEMVDPGEGYNSIASALRLHAKLFGKKEGLIKESQLEQDADWQRMEEDMRALDS